MPPTYNLVRVKQFTRDKSPKTPDIFIPRLESQLMAGRKPTVTDEEIIQEMILSHSPVVTAKELSDLIDMTPQGAIHRLENLQEDGLVRSKKVGAAAKVWWPTDRGRDLVTGGGQSSGSQ